SPLQMGKPADTAQREAALRDRHRFVRIDPCVDLDGVARLRCGDGRPDGCKGFSGPHAKRRARIGNEASRGSVERASAIRTGGAAAQEEQRKQSDPNTSARVRVKHTYGFLLLSS